MVSWLVLTLFKPLPNCTGSDHIVSQILLCIRSHAESKHISRWDQQRAACNQHSPPPTPGHHAYHHPFDPSMPVLKQESKELSKVHGRMSKDLATIAGRKKTCAFALTVKALSSYDTEGLGFVKVTHNLYY